MAWVATIEAVLNSPSNNGTKDIVVHYTNQDRLIIRRYNIHPENYPTVNVTTSFIKDQVDRLNQFDSVVSDLEAIIGTEIV
jgi:hypothetical protein